MMMKSKVDLDKIIACCSELLERMHVKNAGEFEVDNTIYSIVAFKLFGYALNTFKSIYYLLPHTVYEQASALYRTLWETGVNFEWISLKPEVRAERFISFTAVEYQNFLQRRIRAARRAKNEKAALALTQQLTAFQQVLERRLGQFRFSDKTGRKRTLTRFSAPSLEALVRELGGEWIEEYDHEYALSCTYTHGAPGAVLFPIFDTSEHEIGKAQSTERAGIVGAGAIDVMTRIYRRWLAVRSMEDEAFLHELLLKVHGANGIGGSRISK